MFLTLPLSREKNQSYKIKKKTVKKSRLVPWWLSRKSASGARAVGSIPGSGRSPGGGIGNALQCSCLENSEDRGAWRTTAHGVAELDTTEHMHTQSTARVTSSEGYKLACVKGITENLLTSNTSQERGQNWGQRISFQTCGTHRQ